MTVGQFTPDGTFHPGGSGQRGIFELEGDFNALSSTTIEFEIAGATLISHDQIDVVGAIDLSGEPVLDVVLRDGYMPPIDQEFVITNNDGADAVTGTFSGLAEGATVSGDFQFEISYVGGDGNDVVLTATEAPPEEILINGFETPEE